MGNKSNNLLLGALEMLILKALVSEDRHGWGISKRLKQISSGTFSLNIGSLYPALYTLLPKGKKHLEDQLANWREFSIAVEAVILS
jgi:DNA-binding PadR family transcriptional regulator